MHARHGGAPGGDAPPVHTADDLPYATPPGFFTPLPAHAPPSGEGAVNCSIGEAMPWYVCVEHVPAAYVDEPKAVPGVSHAVVPYTFVTGPAAHEGCSVTVHAHAHADAPASGSSTASGAG